MRAGFADPSGRWAHFAIESDYAKYVTRESFHVESVCRIIVTLESHRPVRSLSDSTGLARPWTKPVRGERNAKVDPGNVGHAGWLRQRSRWRSAVDIQWR